MNVRRVTQKTARRTTYESCGSSGVRSLGTLHGAVDDSFHRDERRLVLRICEGLSDGGEPRQLAHDALQHCHPRAHLLKNKALASPKPPCPVLLGVGVTFPTSSIILSARESWSDRKEKKRKKKEFFKIPKNETLEHSFFPSSIAHPKVRSSILLLLLHPRSSSCSCSCSCFY